MRHRPSRNGFTLVEVLVAFAIAALGLAALMQVFGTGLRSAAVSSAFARAAMLAESELAAVGIATPLIPGEYIDSTEDGFRRHLSIAPYEEAGLQSDVQIYRVQVVVSWGERDDGDARAVSLQTLRLVRAD